MTTIDNADDLIPAIVAAPDDIEATDADVEEQSLWPFGKKTVEAKIDPVKLRESIDEISRKLDIVLESQRATKKGANWELETFTVGLAVSASGGVFMIAQAGIEASIELTFRRKQ